MGITRALGLGLFFVILATLMPTVFAELTKTILVFLQSSQQALSAAGILAAHAAASFPPLH